jgi:hypothetical protein
MERKCSTNVIIFTLIVTNKEEWTHAPLHQKSSKPTVFVEDKRDFWYDFIIPKYFIVFKNYKLSLKNEFSAERKFFYPPNFLLLGNFSRIYGEIWSPTEYPSLLMSESNIFLNIIIYNEITEYSRQNIYL